MAVYKCRVCGAVYDEEKEGRPVSELDGCPVCRQPVSNLVPMVEEEEKSEEKQYSGGLDYDAETVRHDASARYME